MVIKYLKKYTWKLPKDDKRNKSIDLKSIVNPKEDKCKEIYAQKHHDKSMKTKNRKKLKAVGENWCII